MTTLLSSDLIAASLTGVGVVVRAPIEGVAALFGAAATGLSFLNKKLSERKVNKHATIYSQAVSKRGVEEYIVSHKEFQHVTREFQKYHEIKDSSRARTQPPTKNGSLPAEVEKSVPRFA